jgi:hypothetical protein
MKTVIKSDVLFRQLKQLIEIPQHVRKMDLRLEINEPVEVIFECYATEPKVDKNEQRPVCDAREGVSGQGVCDVESGK